MTTSPKALAKRVKKVNPELTQNTPNHNNLGGYKSGVVAVRLFESADLLFWQIMHDEICKKYPQHIMINFIAECGAIAAVKYQQMVDNNYSMHAETYLRMVYNTINLLEGKKPIGLPKPASTYTPGNSGGLNSKRRGRPAGAGSGRRGSISGDDAPGVATDSRDDTMPDDIAAGVLSGATDQHVDATTALLAAARRRMARDSGGKDK